MRAFLPGPLLCMWTPSWEGGRGGLLSACSDDCPEILNNDRHPPAVSGALTDLRIFSRDFLFRFFEPIFQVFFNEFLNGSTPLNPYLSNSIFTSFFLPPCCPTFGNCCAC